MPNNNTSTFPENNHTTSVNHSVKIPIDGGRLRQARIACQLTLDEVTQKVSINKMTLLRYETGDIRMIAPERLERLAQLYGTTPAYLNGIPSAQEFTTDQDLQIIPFSADPPTALGRRLSIALSAFNHSLDPETDTGLKQ